jgi:uncharacterized protein YbbK (DUF523 family)
LVSACLLGLPTRYDGRAKRSQQVLDFLAQYDLTPVPVCPEQLAGLPTPRAQSCFARGDGAAVLDGRGEVVALAGDSMNEAFCRGAQVTLAAARASGCEVVLFKERSPSCGVHQVYQGDTLVEGRGVTAALLIRQGLAVFSEEDILKGEAPPFALAPSQDSGKL